MKLRMFCFMDMAIRKLFFGCFGDSCPTEKATLFEPLDDTSNGLVSRSFSETPPQHYRMKIVSFSSLKSEDKYESSEFTAGEYKWKLVLFPNGNKKRKVGNHISLYLEMSQERPIEAGWIVTIDYRLFLLNRQKEKKTYLVLEDLNKNEKKYCFYRTIVGGSAGFDRFISLDEFNDASNGYLVDDTCEFGAEVVVSKTRRTGKGELVSMNLNCDVHKFVWKVTDFSKLEDRCYYSEPFTATNNQKYCTWKLKLQPKGANRGKGSHLSLCLLLNKLDTLPTSSKILAEYTLRIVDQGNGHLGGVFRNLFSRKDEGWFENSRGRGYPEFIEQEGITVFLKNDICMFEVEITIKGISIPGISP